MNASTPEPQIPYLGNGDQVLVFDQGRVFAHTSLRDGRERTYFEARFVGEDGQRVQWRKDITDDRAPVGWLWRALGGDLSDARCCPLDGWHRFKGREVRAIVRVCTGESGRRITQARWERVSR